MEDNGTDSIEKVIAGAEEGPQTPLLGRPGTDTTDRVVVVVYEPQRAVRSGGDLAWVLDARVGVVGHDAGGGYPPDRRSSPVSDPPWQRWKPSNRGPWTLDDDVFRS